MCGIIDKYIKQIFPKGELYSDCYSKVFTAAAPDIILEVDYRKEGARGIIVHSVFIQSSAGVTLHNLTDNNNNILIQFVDQANVTGIYHLNHYINSGILKLRITGGSGKTLATAQYQYIYDKDNRSPQDQP